MTTVSILCISSFCFLNNPSEEKVGASPGLAIFKLDYHGDPSLQSSEYLTSRGLEPSSSTESNYPRHDQEHPNDTHNAAQAYTTTEG
jgi:hypothetical protein